MTSPEDDPDDRDPTDGDREPTNADDRGSIDGDGRQGFVDALVALLREIAEAEGGRTRTRGDFDRFGGASVDFSITAGSLADHFGPPPIEPADEPAPSVTTRETPDGYLVVADLRGIAGDDPSTRVDGETGELVVATGEGVAGRVPLEDSDLHVANARLNNDVLEVHLARTH